MMSFSSVIFLISWPYERCRLAFYEVLYAIANQYFGREEFDCFAGGCRGEEVPDKCHFNNRARHCHDELGTHRLLTRAQMVHSSVASAHYYAGVNVKVAATPDRGGGAVHFHLELTMARLKK